MSGAPPARVQTVLGPVAPAALGRVLMHEHVLCDVTPPGLFAPGTARVAVTLENLHAIRHGWTTHYGNHILDDRELMTAELRDFAAAGGGTVVDLTVHGLSPDPEGLAEVARRAGVHIVAGAGYYIEDFAGALVGDRETEALADEMISALRQGIAGTRVRAGILGEIGVSDPWRPVEKRVMLAAVLAQQETGASISVHPGRDPGSPREVIAFVKAHGGDPQRLIIGHLDRTITTADEALAIADTGAVLEWDFFGIEASYYPFRPTFDLPNDGARLTLIGALLQRGLGRQVLISHDICTLTRLRRRGGHGYAHILNSVVPLMRHKGFEQAQIDTILQHNPQRLLAMTG
ncbi:MAG: phosphotriesterase-related protein [Roseovarius sp.]